LIGYSEKSGEPAKAATHSDVPAPERTQ
jgi:hypothetical protein